MSRSTSSASFSSPANVPVAAQLVEKSGFSARKASSGFEAVSLLSKTNDVTLVLMDCHMPNKDGFETTRELRARHGAVAQTWVVAVTASALSDELRQCREAGMDDVVTKPLTLTALHQALARASGARHA